MRGSSTAPLARLRIHFDLSNLETWHRREWERTLERASSAPSDGAVLIEGASAADCIVTAGTPWHFSTGGRVFGRLPLRADSTPRFVWDGGDQPAGRESGWYCSLPRPLFDRRRHRTFRYPIRYNECVEAADLADARVLYGFHGGITSGVRARLLAALVREGRADEMDIHVEAGPWNRMFDRTGVPEKRRYAEALRRTRFVLCPRGNGVGTVRMFETLESARVPVIISDQYVLPAEIDWDACAVRVRERDVRKIPALLRERAADWPRLAQNARQIWEENFSDAACLSRLTADLRAFLATPQGEPPTQQLRLRSYWLRTRVRRAVGHLAARAATFSPRSP